MWTPSGCPARCPVSFKLSSSVTWFITGAATREMSYFKARRSERRAVSLSEIWQGESQMRWEGCWYGSMLASHGALMWATSAHDVAFWIIQEINDAGGNECWESGNRRVTTVTVCLCFKEKSVFLFYIFLIDCKKKSDFFIWIVFKDRTFTTPVNLVSLKPALN